MFHKIFTVCLFFYTQVSGFVLLLPKEYVVPQTNYVTPEMLENALSSLESLENLQKLDSFGGVDVNTNNNFYYEYSPNIGFNIIPELSYQNWDRSDNLVGYDYKATKIDTNKYNRPKYHIIMEYPNENDPNFMQDPNYEPYQIDPFYDFDYEEVKKHSPRKARQAENKYVVSDKDILSSNYIITKRTGLTAVVTDTGYRIMHEISPGVVKEIRVDYENMVF